MKGQHLRSIISSRWKFGSLSKLTKNGNRLFTTTQQLKVNKPPVDVEYTQLLIGGKFVNGISEKTMAVIDPRTGEEVAQLAKAEWQDIDIAVKDARYAFENGPWSKMSGYSRGKILNNVADLISQNMDTLAKLESLDVGKPLWQSYGDMELCEELFRYYAGYSDKIHGKTIPCNNINNNSRHFAYTLHEPLGVCAAITPWNYPMLLMAFTVAPALAAGNSVIVKTSENTALTSLYLGKLIIEAGVPNGVVNVVNGYGDEAGTSLASHNGIDKIAFTGSTHTGKKIMSLASDNLTPVVLLLSGKCPSIIFDDCNIDEAVEVHKHGVFYNQGQSCIQCSRIYCHENIYDQFVEKIVSSTKNIVIGDPFIDGTQHGPQQNKKQFDKILKYIQIGKSEGATLLTGGNKINYNIKDVNNNQLNGYFVEPTIFGDVIDDMKISRDEIFGPLMQISKFQDTDEVIKRANDTQYGLASGIMTNDIDRIHYVSRALKSGTVWVNTYDIFDTPVPFGGYKHSGIGRVKGENGVESFTQIKAVVHNLPKHGGWY